MSAPRFTRRVVVVLALALSVSVWAASPASAAAGPAKTVHGSYNGLALTPPMGYNDWSYYGCNVDQGVILSQARALVRTGLSALGYDTVTTDDCWMAATRAPTGGLRVDPTRFPRGMAYIGRRLHAIGLKFGLYEDAGTQTCGGFAGSWRRYRQTAEQFARWGVDYVKLDGCHMPKVDGQSREQTYDQAYARFSRALLATGRPIVFSASAPADFRTTPQWHQVIAATSKIANLWRTGADIPHPQVGGTQEWDGIAYNFGYNVGLDRYAGPGHWNDPDMLLVGDPGLTPTEMQSQMTLWSEMAAPLIIGTDLTQASPAALRILANRRIIAVDQDRRGVQGHIVQSGSGYDVLTKPLSDGASVVLFDQAQTGRTIETTAAAAGLPSARSYELTDLVTGRRTQTTGTIASGVRGHGTVIVRVRPRAGAGLPSAASVSIGRFADTPDAPEPITATVTDDGRAPIFDGSLTLAVPDGWSVTPAARALPRIAALGHATVRFSVTPGSPPAGGTLSELDATARYRSAGHTTTQTGRIAIGPVG
jgi:alpha-galactosidase